MPTMVMDGLQRKMACGPCIRGHRSSKCNHDNRLLVEIRQPGRPLAKCPHDVHPCSCDRLVVVNYAVPLSKACPCKARSILSPAQVKDESACGKKATVHTADCIHNAANVDILSGLIVVDSAAGTDDLPVSVFKSSCCGGTVADEAPPNPIALSKNGAGPLPACCSSKQPKQEGAVPDLSLLEALQRSDTNEPTLVAYYIHRDGKLCSRVEAHKTPQGHLTTTQKSVSPPATGSQPDALFSSNPSSGSSSAVNSRVDLTNGASSGAPAPAAAAAAPSPLHMPLLDYSSVAATPTSLPIPPVPHPTPYATSQPSLLPQEVAWQMPTQQIGSLMNASDNAHHGVHAHHHHLHQHIPLNACLCGEACSCVGCPQHLSNDATMEYVLYHIAASDLAQPPPPPPPPQAAELDQQNHSQMMPPIALPQAEHQQAWESFNPIPQEWTMYESAFDFLAGETPHTTFPDDSSLLALNPPSALAWAASQQLNQQHWDPQQ